MATDVLLQLQKNGLYRFRAMHRQGSPCPIGRTIRTIRSLAKRTRLWWRLRIWTSGKRCCRETNNNKRRCSFFILKLQCRLWLQVLSRHGIPLGLFQLRTSHLRHVFHSPCQSMLEESKSRERRPIHAKHPQHLRG